LRILTAAINTTLPLIMLIVLFTFSARGESYSIENILNIRTAVPEGKGNFMGTNLPVYLGKGQAAFRAEGGEGQEGIYIYKDGVITRAVDGNTVLVEEGGTIRKIGNPVSLGGGGFAFIAESESGEAGIYEYRNGTVDVLLDNRTENKSSEAKFQGFRDLKPADKDSLTFTADTGGRSRALYLLNKTKLTLIASTNTEMPGSKDKFKKLDETVPLGGGALAFWGRGEGGKSGIYIYSGGKLETAVNTDTPLPGGEGKFKKLGNPVSIGGGDMVFTARGVKGSGLYRYSKGKVTEVAGTNTALSGQGDKAVTLDSISRDPLVLNNGDVVFQASGAGGVRGIYAAGEGGVRVIADTSTPIPVGEGDFTKFVRSETLVGGGVVFKASGKDKQNGIYVSKGGSIFLVADKNMDLPVGNGKFRYFGDFMPAEEGNFLFFAEGYEGQIGLYEAVYGGK
jgi:hypothetical protein